ncbi:hypothetical protein CYLTODRAFT_418970, partial [Cylindrobasidium torrendii FP15055 ss-10]
MVDKGYVDRSARGAQSTRGQPKQARANVRDMHLIREMGSRAPRRRKSTPKAKRRQLCNWGPRIAWCFTRGLGMPSRLTGLWICTLENEPLSQMLGIHNALRSFDNTMHTRPHLDVYNCAFGMRHGKVVGYEYRSVMHRHHYNSSLFVLCLLLCTSTRRTPSALFKIAMIVSPWITQSSYAMLSRCWPGKDPTGDTYDAEGCSVSRDSGVPEEEDTTRKTWDAAVVDIASDSGSNAIM